jgi:hypothetical protein
VSDLFASRRLDRPEQVSVEADIDDVESVALDA